MGVVYKAEDTKLGRPVAIKVLPQNLSGDTEAKSRFVREAKAASSLDHINICTIYEIDEMADGRIFMAMAFCDGRTVREYLAQGPLETARAVDIAIGAARGLERAHERGIIHRDIKPANIMVTRDSVVKIMDFGIAKLAGEATMTRTASTIGTVAYMSPEQANGRAIDNRTDIWSLGVVLYEMLTGRRPFVGDYEQATIYSILNEEPKPPSAVRRDVPTELDRIVMKAMAKSPTERFQRAGEMRMVLEACARTLAAGTASEGAAGEERSPSIAVLPFTNLSADKENEYFSDGLAEDIIDALTHVPGLRVMARTSAFAFRGKEADVREIGARLNVEHILEGSVRRAGSRLRVTAQLVKASDGYHLWSQRFDREMTDIFAIQDEISQAIVEKLRVRLSGNAPLVKRYTENLAAYDLCLKARYHLLKMTQEGREAGRQYCEQAIALDPKYALAHVVLAESYLWSAYWGSTNPRAAFSGAKSSALEALRLDDTIADAHSALGTVLGSGEFDWPGAEREFRRALELSPSSAAVRYDYAWCYAMWFLFPLGRLEQAMTEMRRALELDPLDPFYNTLLGYLLHSARQSGPAVAQLRHAIDIDPTFFFPYWFLSVALIVTGQLDEAITAAEKANELSGGHALTLGSLARVYGLVGRTAETRQLLEELTVRRQSTYVPASAFVFVYSGLGKLDSCLEWIARGIEERDPILVTALKSAPTIDPLRSHPAFQSLLQNMNLEP